METNPHRNHSKKCYTEKPSSLKEIRENWYSYTKGITLLHILMYHSVSDHSSFIIENK